MFQSRFHPVSCMRVYHQAIPIMHPTDGCDSICMTAGS
jgi:hypothetical protein